MRVLLGIAYYRKQNFSTSYSWFTTEFGYFEIVFQYINDYILLNI